MKPQFICHPDFADLTPRSIYHKEMDKQDIQEDPAFQNRHLLFRRTAQLPAFRQATLQISADDYYKLYINGSFVTSGPAPSYPHAYYYNEIDVTDFLQNGDNLFAVHTYYQGLCNRVQVSCDRRHMLWFSLNLDGKTVLVSDSQWHCADHRGFSSRGVIGYKTAFAERYDSRAEECNFFSPDFDDSNWGFAALRQHADYTLIRQPTQQLEYSTVAPAKAEQIGNILRLDFGREAVGMLTAIAHGRAGDEILIRFGEELNDDGSVRYNMRCNCIYEDSWVLSGGKDTLNQFDYKGFRYAELVLPDGVTVREPRMIVRHYPFEKRAAYPTHHPDLNRILTLCTETLKYGVQEIYPDCPTREKGQYLNDMMISGRSHAALTQDTTFLKKSIQNFFDSSVICPGLMAVSTASFMQEIADASLQLPALVAWVYALDGDLDFLRNAEPYLTGIYRHFLKSVNNDGLLVSVTDKWNLVDWPQNLRDEYDFPLTRPVGEGIHNVINAYWCGFLDTLDEIYKILKLAPLGIAEKTKSAFFKTFYCEETGLFRDAPDTVHSAVHSNVLPLLFNIGTQDPAIRQRIVKLISEKRLSSMGVSMAYFTLAALKQHGYDDLVWELTLDPTCWLNMLQEGATTTFEAWGKDQKWNASLFHPWATAPLIIFAEGVRAY